MLSLLMELSVWHWMSFAFAILVIEMLMGSYYLLWVSFAAFITGLSEWVFGLSWQAQFTVFTVMSIVSVIAWYEYDKRRDKTPTRPNLNKRGHQYVGRTFQLSQAIINGVGKIKVDDSTWKVKGTDSPNKSKVKVIDVDGTVLIVELI